MGAEIAGPQSGDRLPLTIRGGELRGFDFFSPVPSAQVKTAMLFAGLQAAGETSITEPSVSRDHTERMLEYLGVSIHRASNRVVVKSTNIFNAESLSIPGDLSSAAFWLVAAAIVPGSEVTVEGVGLNPTRTGILDVLEAFGANVVIHDRAEMCGEPRGTVTVSPGERRPVAVGGDLVPRLVDELPLVALLGAVAEGETILSDAGELRVKESDRIATTAAGVTAMGAEVETTSDGLVVRGPVRLRGAHSSSSGDHRIAMMLAVAGLAAEGETTIEGWDSVAVSYPEFLADLDALTAR
jgi:3-phosphoshikimate 1-carboxyvinyltransferase